ncbi:hypothetical protein A7985_07550 [Pseudoalteromonas luteoviolacea]|uniref:Uncharacterized protein n=1 Tax=Pseudoalteromonas luteoviolacea TaxID=43657 RepID=A0A1C0TWT2_9GAMM|nr:hypothetical protein [Pseudoalteromonas luteoviolacea]OCQ23785.1 hypothetical protein A7985_07550 [Pseudoalteromonas luteoviolacea]
MKFYRCINSNCSDLAPYNEERAKKYSYRCIASMGKLEETEHIQYKHYLVGDIFDAHVAKLNVLVAILVSGIVFYIKPVNFGWYVLNEHFGLMLNSFLFIFLKSGIYIRTIIDLEKQVLTLENNFRKFKAFVVLLACLSVLALLIAYT